MKKVPSYELVCELLDGDDRAWQSMKPLVKLALLVFPGLICGGFGTAANTLASLSNGDTLNTVFDTVEAAWFPIKQRLFRKKPSVGDAYNKLRLVNGMLILCAYFDIFSENNPQFWKKLKLTGNEARWLTETAREDHGRAEKLMGSDGKLGDHQKALEYGLKALTIRKRVLPENHPDLAASYNNVGTTYGDLGDHEKALEYKLKALSIQKQVLPENHPDLATSYNNVGSAYGELGDHEKALEYKLKALSIQKQVLPENHPLLAASYNNVGITYGELGDHEKALEYEQKALTIQAQALPENHPHLAQSNYNVGYTLIKLERYTEAVAYTRAAAAIAKTAFPEGHPIRAKILKGAEIAEYLARRQAGAET